MEDVEHFAGKLRSERAFFRDQPKELHEPIGGHAVVDSMLEGELVLDATRKIDAAEMESFQHLLQVFQPQQIEQQVRRQIAAANDHVSRQLTDAHRLPHRPLHFGVGVALRQHAERAAVIRAPKPVSNVQSRLRQQFAVMNRREHAE